MSTLPLEPILLLINAGVLVSKQKFYINMRAITSNVSQRYFLFVASQWHTCMLSHASLCMYQYDSVINAVLLASLALDCYY